MTGAQRALDWPEAYARLARARQALDAGPERAPEEAQRILAERARALAKPIEDAPTPSEVVDLLVFSLAGERYGIAAASIVEVIPLGELVTMPGTPRVVLGIVNHRGRILPVLDLRRVFDLAGESVPEESRVVAVEAGRVTFGIFAEAVAGVVRIANHELASPPVVIPTGDRGAFIRGVTGEMVAVLDLEALIQDPRLVVNDQVG